MKQLLAILGAIAVVGLSSCATHPNSSPAVAPSVPTNPQVTIKAGGSSSTVDFLRILKAAYEADTKTDQVSLLEPGQSENIIAGIKQGLIDVGAISKPLKPEDKDGTLEFRQVAQDALLVATHPSVTGVQNLTTDNLKAIYSGSITNWQQLGGPNAPIVVLDRPEDESAKRLLRKHYLGKDLPSAPTAVVFRKEGELIQTIQSTPNSIGAFSLAYAISHNLAVNRLSLNAVEPTLDNLKTGRYSMARTIGVVWLKKATPTTQAFITYISSSSGMKVLEQSGFAPMPLTAAAKQK